MSTLIVVPGPELDKCRAAFEKYAVLHSVSLVRFNMRPDEYKFAHTVFLWGLYQDAWLKAKGS